MEYGKTRAVPGPLLVLPGCGRLVSGARRPNGRRRSATAVLHRQFDAGNAALIRRLRAALGARLAGCAELIYDNYNFFVIGYSPTERPSDYIVSIAASASGAGLSFNRGAELHDPDCILKGSGKVNRFIRLPSANVLDRPEVDTMIERACDLSKVPKPWLCGGKLIIRSVSAKQRPRRP